MTNGLLSVSKHCLLNRKIGGKWEESVCSSNVTLKRVDEKNPLEDKGSLELRRGLCTSKWFCKL